MVKGEVWGWCYFGEVGVGLPNDRYFSAGLAAELCDRFVGYESAGAQDCYLVAEALDLA